MEYPKRKPNRLRDYDYSKEGVYFITICIKDKQAILSEVFADDSPVGADSIRPKLTRYGVVVEKAIKAIPAHYPNINPDKYVIMPDHVHLILIISNDGINGRILSAPTAKTISTVIAQMKRWVSKETGVSIWQKSYYDHIIRDENDYLVRWNYIEENPGKWLEKETGG